jgi:hypothetical protein
MTSRIFGNCLFLVLAFPLPAFAREWPRTTAEGPFLLSLFLWLLLGPLIKRSFPDLSFPDLSSTEGDVPEIARMARLFSGLSPGR